MKRLFCIFGGVILVVVLTVLFIPGVADYI